MADVVLRFDATARRWECGMEGASWDVLDQSTALLQVARTSGGRAVGFALDVDVDDADFARSLAEVSSLFGPDVADVIRDAPGNDVEVVVPRAGAAVAPVVDGTGEVMRPSPRLNARASEPVILDDPAAGIVSVTLTVPWWARFARPWIAVRRRGRRDILLTGPLRVKGRTATAVLRYGMPYPGAALSADVVKGPKPIRWVRRLASTAAVVALVAGAAVLGRPGGSTEPPTVPGPVSWEIESGGFVFERITFEEGKRCLASGDRITVVGRGFDASGGDYGLYLAVWDEFLEPIPPDQLVPVASAIESPTAISAIVPPVGLFPTPPVGGEPVTVVLVSDRNAPSAYGSTVADWCGDR